MTHGTTGGELHRRAFCVRAVFQGDEKIWRKVVWLKQENEPD